MEIITHPNTYLMEFCHFSNITPLYLLSRKRDQQRVTKRQLYSYFGCKYLGFKNKALSREIGQDRTTGLNSLKQIQGLIDVGDTLIIESIEHLKISFDTINEKSKAIEERYDELLAWTLGVKANNRKLKKENEDLKLQLTNKEITA